MESSVIEGRLTALLRRTRLQSRLMAVSLLLSLAPVLVVGFFAYQVYTRSIHDNLAQSSEQAVRLLNATVASELEKYAAYINSISVLEDVQNILLRTEPERVLPDGSVTQAIKQNMEQVPVQSRYLRNIRVVDISHNVLYDFGFDDISPAQFESLLAGLDASTPNDALQYVRTYRGANMLVLGRRIYEFAYSSNPIGYILIYMKEEVLSEGVFADIDFGPGSNIMLMDGQGRVLSSQDDHLLGDNLSGPEGLLLQVKNAAWEGKNALNTAIGEEEHLVVFDYGRDIDTYFLATIPMSVITTETRQITGRLVIVALLTVLASAMLTMLLYRSIVRPIQRMVTFCGEATVDKIDRHLSDNSADELGFLAQAIDRFVHEIQHLLHKSKQDERRKRALELEMLQYQINPHFLFNTLNTLKWVAVLNDVPVLSDGISSLSRLLQSTLLRTEERILLREELENARHYISIQKIRYADNFQVAYDVDEAMLDIETPRFILQPLVENAILHGAKENGESLLIRIGCRYGDDGCIVLTVEDNGQGFEAGQLPQKSSAKFSGIGLSNVQERIRLSFGEPFGLHIESTPGAGTRCWIILPGKNAPKGES